MSRRYTKIDRSPTGVAERCGVSPTTVYNEIRDGKLKAKKLGSRTIIPAQSEADWMTNLPDAVFENGRIVAES